MEKAVIITQIFLSICITTAVLLQASGSGLGSTWSGGGETYHTKRGIEKVLYYATIVLIALFAINSIAVLIFA